MFGEPHVTNTMIQRLTGYFFILKKEYFSIRVSIFRMQLLFEWRFTYCVVSAWICACFFVHSMSGWLWQVSSCAQIWLMGTAIAKENKNQCIAICKLRRKNKNKISPTETNSENQTDDLLLLYACTVHTRFGFGDFNCISFFLSFGSFLFVAVVASFFFSRQFILLCHQRLL